MNKVIILFVLLVYFGVIYSQKGVNFGKDCLLNNSLIMAKVLYQSIEKDSLNNILEKNLNFTMVCELNSSGQFIKFRKIWNQHALSKNMIDKIEKRLLLEKTCFYVCYEPESQSRKEDIVESIKKKGFASIVISFPGEIISLYGGKNTCKKGAIVLSKYDFIKDLITKRTVQN